MPLAFSFPLVDYDDSIGSGISTLLLVDKCYTLTDITDNTEVAAAIASNDMYKLCVLDGELPKPTTESFTETTHSGPKDRLTKKVFNLNAKAYMSVANHSELDKIDGSSTWRVALLNSTSSDTRVLRFFDVVCDSIVASEDQSGNSQDNRIMVDIDITWKTTMSPSQTSSSNGEVYDVTSDSALLTTLDCTSGDCP